MTPKAVTSPQILTHSRKEHDMKIIGGKIRLGQQITIELDDGKVITRKVQSTGRNCSIWSYVVNINGRKVKVTDIERAEAELDETGKRLIAELQKIYDSMTRTEAKGMHGASDGYREYYCYAEMFTRDIIGHDITIRDGRVVAIAG